MENETSRFKDKQYQLSLMAGMNQRYHQERARIWTLLDRSFKIAVGILAVVGACMAVVTMFAIGLALDVTSIVVASLAAFVAIVLNVLPFGEWASLHHGLFQRWTDLREDVDGLLFDLQGEPTSENWERLRQFDAKVHRINASEPGCNQKLLNECYASEERSRHPGKARRQLSASA